MKWNGMQWRAWALAAGLFFSMQAQAQNEETRVSSGGGGGRFGSMGQLVISNDFYGAMGYTSVSGGGDNFFITLRPAGDYFLKENLSLGGFVVLSAVLRDGFDTTEFGLGVRGGINIWMNDKVSVWPRLGLGIVNGENSFNYGDNTFLAVDLTAPFLVHFAPHFFIGGGPGLTTLIGDDTAATLSVQTLVGGYF